MLSASAVAPTAAAAVTAVSGDAVADTVVDALAPRRWRRHRRAPGRRPGQHLRRHRPHPL